MKIEPATDADVAEINEWRYEPPYDFYDSPDDPLHNSEHFFVVRDDDDTLIGFYSFGPKDDCFEYGLGLRPGLPGRGLGLDFVRTGLTFGRNRYAPRRGRLYVAAFNDRAIKVYERAGFVETGRHIRTFPRWGDVEFVEMDEQR